MAAKKTTPRTRVEGRGDQKVVMPRPIRLDDLLPDTDVRGGACKAVVFGQRNGEGLPKK